MTKPTFHFQMDFDTLSLNQLSNENFCSLLKMLPGEKDLFLPENIMKAMDQFAGLTVLKSCSVKKIFRYDRRKKVYRPRSLLPATTLEDQNWEFFACTRNLLKLI